MKKTNVLAQKFRELFPGIDMKVAYRWAGTFGEAKDGLAYIGQIRQMPRCHFALGFGGNGISFSAVAADLIHDAIAGKANPDSGVFAFDR